METNMTTKTEEARARVPAVAVALGASARAWVTGTIEIGRAVAGHGREIAGETGEHLRATARAKGARELAELQLGFAQHRLEMTATYARELIELARSGSEQVIAPLGGLLTDKATGGTREETRSCQITEGVEQ